MLKPEEVLVTGLSQATIMRAVDVAIAWTAFAATSIHVAVAKAVCSCLHVLLYLR